MSASRMTKSNPKRRKTRTLERLIRRTMAILVLVMLIITIIFQVHKRMPKELQNPQKLVLVDNKKVSVLYESNMEIDVPLEVYANKDETFGDILARKNDEELLYAFNKIMPETLDGVLHYNRSRVKINVARNETIPTVEIDGKKIVSATALNDMVEQYYDVVTIETPEGTVTTTAATKQLVVDVLNANGRGGHARRTGEAIKKALEGSYVIEYNAANYQELSQESYIVVKSNVSRNTALELIESLPEKYFKIRESITVPTLAEVVIILGKEEQIRLSIDVIGAKDATADHVKTLRDAGYKNIRSVERANDGEVSEIEYNPEDYYIAAKIALKLDKYNFELVPREDLSNKINIIVK